MQSFFPYEVYPKTVQTLDKFTLPIELPKTGQMTALDIYMEAKNGSDQSNEKTYHNINNFMFQNVTKLELTGDGVDKIFSLSGPALMKYLWWVQGKCPLGYYSGRSGQTQWQKFRYLFGRSFGDKDYLLNLGKYRRLVLELSYDLATVTAVGNDGFTTQTAGFHVVGHMTPPGKSMSSKGARRVVERKSFTSLASGETEWEFVQDYPYTGIGIYARERGEDDGADITNVKLDLGAGMPVLYDYSWLETERLMASMKEIDATFHQYQSIKDQSQIETWVGNDWHEHAMGFYEPAATDYSHTLMIAQDNPGDYVKYHVIGNTTDAPSTWAAVSTYVRAKLSNRGYSVGNFLYLPLADYPDWNNPLLPTEVGDALLRLTNGGAGATVNILSEQIIPQV